MRTTNLYVRFSNIWQKALEIQQISRDITQNKAVFHTFCPLKKEGRLFLLMLATGLKVLVIDGA